MTYQCDTCGYLFDHPKIKREYMGEYWGAPAYEEFGVCPYCGGDDVEILENADADCGTDQRIVDR